jgi:hypothetical protein
VFTVEERDRVRDHVLELASTDPRVVAGAAVGALAGGGGDRWSDLDLTFGVVDGVSVTDVLDDWSRDLAESFDAAHLFDLPHGSSVYRVFLLPGCLQFDLSVTPASEFGALGPKFELLFGSAVERQHFPQPSPEESFGLGVHHAVRARFCIERGRFWQAEFWISGVRDEALVLACLRHGVEARYGRGLDQLPAEVLAPFEDTLVRSLDREELLRALGRSVAGLLRESAAVPEVAAKVEAQLQELT